MGVRRKACLLISLTSVFVWLIFNSFIEDGGMSWGLLSGLAFLIGYFGLGVIFGFPNESERDRIFVQGFGKQVKIQTH